MHIYANTLLLIEPLPSRSFFLVCLANSYWYYKALSPMVVTPKQKQPQPSLCSPHIFPMIYGICHTGLLLLVHLFPLVKN